MLSDLYVTLHTKATLQWFANLDDIKQDALKARETVTSTLRYVRMKYLNFVGFP